MKYHHFLAVVALVLVGCQKQPQVPVPVEIIGIKLGDFLGDYEKYFGEEKEPGIRAFSGMYSVRLNGYITPDNWIVEAGVGPAEDFQINNRKIAYLYMARELQKDCDAGAVDDLINKLRTKYAAEFQESVVVPLNPEDKLRLKQESSSDSLPLRFTANRKVFLAASPHRMIQITADCHHRHKHGLKLEAFELDLTRYAYKDPKKIEDHILNTLQMIQGYEKRKI